MFGDFITRILILLLGYAYPSFMCFKTVEKKKSEIQELRFWCQYWIILAIFTVLERIGDMFVSWLPMYGEIKVAFLVYLWYSKTKGTEYLYETLLRPYVAAHESDIDRNILEIRTRGFDLLIRLWQTGLLYAKHLADRLSKTPDSTLEQKDDRKNLPATSPTDSGNPNNAAQEEGFYSQTGELKDKREIVLDRDNVTPQPNIRSIFRFRHTRR